MTSEIDVNGKTFITSKLAAKESGYAQDYIGQLARGGQIEAKQSGGLWYVDLDSVKTHKANAAEFTPTPPQGIVTPRKIESVVTFDGKEYVSSKRGAKITGYSQDYVTQLARSGKILSRQISNRWYVSKEQLIANKTHNDSLLASVQSESVGYKREREELKSNPEQSAPELNYFSDDKDLMPTVPKKIREDIQKNIEDQEEGISNQIHDIPIKVGSFGANPNVISESKGKRPISVSQHVLDLDEILGEETQEKSPAGMKFALAGAALTTLLVVVVGIGMFLPSSYTFTRNDSSSTSVSASSKTFKQTASAVASTIQNYTKNIFGGSLKYNR